MSRSKAATGRAGTALAAFLTICPTAPAHAQAPSSFEVASVKENKSGDPGARLDLSRGQLQATNVTLQMIIRVAFEVTDAQIVDAPGWVVSDRFDINAKAPPGFEPAGDLRPLVRSLLAERFRLLTRMEMRDMPLYALVRAKAGGSLGPNIRQGARDCAAGPPTPPPAPGSVDGDWPYCSVSITPGSLYLGGYPISEVTRLLSTLVGRTIIDESGITEPVQFKLLYRPASAASTDDRLDIFTALDEQTGLKLQPRRGPVDVLVIDRVERPELD